jgi:hypothetical protein
MIFIVCLVNVDEEVERADRIGPLSCKVCDQGQACPGVSQRGLARRDLTWMRFSIRSSDREIGDDPISL